MQTNRLNPAVLVGKVKALEAGISRQFALNEAAAEKILRQQEELEQQGSFITVLVELLGGRIDIPTERLKAIPLGTKVAFSYPTDERPSFVMQIVHENPEEAEARELASLEARLKAAGISEEEIEQLKRQVDGAAADAEKLFDPATPAEERKLPCGCVTCVCAGDGACAGCGASESERCADLRRQGINPHAEVGQSSMLVGADGRPL